MADIVAYVAIGIVTIIIGTAIYIGRILYKEKLRKDLENSGDIQNLEQILELEPLPYEEKESLPSSKTNTQKDSQSQTSSSITLSQGKERKSSSKNNTKRNTKIVKSRPRSFQLSKNIFTNGSNGNGGSKYSSKYSSRNSSVNSSLVIKIPKDLPPPPPPSPLKPRDDDSFLNIIPSDILESTSTPIMSSNSSSPILPGKKSQSDLKAQSFIPFHDNSELV